MRALIVIALLLAPVPSFAQVSSWTSRTVLISGHAADFWTTRRAIHLGAVEANPLLGQNPKQQVLVLSISAGAVELWTEYLRRHGHVKLANVFSIAIGGEHFAAAVSNLHVASIQRQINAGIR